MKKIMSRLGALATYGIVAFLVIGTIAGAFTGKPLLLTAVRSESMYPALTRGDLVLLWPAGRQADLGVGDVIVFKVDEGSLHSAGWVIHRVVGGDRQSGFETQGDNNDTADQHRGANPRIMPANIAARAVSVAGTPLHVPLVGYIPLLAEAALGKPIVLAGAALFILALAFLPQRRHPRQRRTRQDTHLIAYALGGVSVIACVAVAGLMLSQQYVYRYTVSAESRAAVLGSPVGQLLVGEQIETKLTTVENNGRLPLILTVSSSDPEVTVSPNRATIDPGSSLDLNVRIEATEPGHHDARIRVGLFYPVLPASLLQALGARHYWLALATVALVMSLPIFALPLLDGSLRARLWRVLRRGTRKLLLRG